MIYIGSGLRNCIRGSIDVKLINKVSYYSYEVNDSVKIHNSVYANVNEEVARMGVLEYEILINLKK